MSREGEGEGVGATVSPSFRGASEASEPGISRFRVWSFGPSRNDVKGLLHRNMRHIHHPANEQWPFARLLSKRCGEVTKKAFRDARRPRLPGPRRELGGHMRHLILAAASVAALALVGPAEAQSPVVIKFSHVVAADTPKGKAAEKFKELAEKYTNGKVKVEVYPNSTLYKDKEELEALQLGAVQMLAPSNSKFGPIGIKEFEVFDLPYILPDLKTLRKVTDGPLGARLLTLLDKKGMTGLAYWDNGFKQMSANKKLVAPSDYKGLKFRIQSSKVLEAQFRELGAIPQVMAFSDVYQALQTGVVDGQENTWSNMYTQKMHEVQKYATVTNHGYIGYVVVVNKKFWDGLPSDIRDQLSQAMKEATEFGNSQSARDNDDALEAIKKSGKTEIVTLTPEQDEAMRKAMMPVYKDVASRVGQPLIDEFLKETGRSPMN